MTDRITQIDAINHIMSFILTHCKRELDFRQYAMHESSKRIIDENGFVYELIIRNGIPCDFKISFTKECRIQRYIDELDVSVFGTELPHRIHPENYKELSSHIGNVRIYSSVEYMHFSNFDEFVTYTIYDSIDLLPLTDNSFNIHVIDERELSYSSSDLFSNIEKQLRNFVLIRSFNLLSPLRYDQMDEEVLYIDILDGKFEYSNSGDRIFYIRAYDVANL